MTGQQRRRGFLASSEGLKRLRDAKFKRGYTSYESLAEAAGLPSDDQVKRLFNPHWGRPIEEKAIENIARVLGLQPTDIVGPKWYLLPILEPVQASGESLTQLSPIESPTPGAEPELPVGQVPLASDLYVERPPIESVCYQEILQPYALLRIHAPRRMGKTWLMSKVLNHVANHDCRTVALNLREAVDRDYTNLDQFLQFFCTSISLGLELSNINVDEHWGRRLGNEKLKCERYFKECLLASDRPLVLALDELDRVYPYPEIAGHFLGMLRTWHESAKTKEIWRKLRVVVVYVETYTQMSDKQSPFNVGKEIELPVFTKKQVRELAQMHELAWDDAQVTQLMGMVSGLPYLVHRAVFHLSTYNDTTLEELLAKAPTFEGIYSEHLQGLLLNLQQQLELELVAALKQVVTADSPVQLDRERASKLYGMGLVQWQGNQVTPSCELYRQLFCEQL